MLRGREPSLRAPPFRECICGAEGARAVAEIGPTLGYACQLSHFNVLLRTASNNEAFNQQLCLAALPTTPPEFGWQR